MSLSYLQERLAECKHVVDRNQGTFHADAAILKLLTLVIAEIERLKAINTIKQ
jgi:hypothetical protein